MKVEYLVDVVPRDVPVALAARNLLVPDRGDMLISSTFVGDGNKRSTLLDSVRFGADALVTPWYNSARTLEVLARARLAGAKLVHFPSEQFFSAAFDEEKLNTASALAYANEVEAVLVWGEYYAKKLVTQVGVPREKVYEVGSARVEFSRYRGSLPNTSEKRSRRILFVSDFTLADLRTDASRKRFNRTYKVGITAEDVAQLGDERDHMIATARAVAEMEGFEVRIRPHPGEQIDAYSNGCRGSGLDVADSAHPMLADVAWADIVVGYTSTSIFEVVAAGKPFFSLRRSRPPDLVWRPALEAIYPSCNASELLSKLSDEVGLREALKDVERQGRYCIGNLAGDYNPVVALVSALQHVSRQGESSALGTHVSPKVLWGAIRSVSKYCAYRFFLSRLWGSLGGSLPTVVKRRTSPGHVLDGQVISEFQKDDTSALNIGHDAEEGDQLAWELGEWCWRPVSVRS